MSKPPLFFIVIIGNHRRRIVSFYATTTGKADNDMAPLQQKLVVVSNKRENRLTIAVRASRSDSGRHQYAL